jgi:hypothetical protein
LPEKTAERTSRACLTVASFLASFGKLRARDASRTQVIIKLTKIIYPPIMQWKSQDFREGIQELHGSATAIATFMIVLCKRDTLPSMKANLFCY